MFIFKNAIKCICRAKGRNVLIGIIALVIAVSACIGLSIRQAAESAKEDTLEGMSVTATISYDRKSMMNNMEPPEKSSDGEDGKGSFDKSQFAEMMGNTSSLTLEEYETYAQSETVEDFYYTLTAYFNGSDTLEPVTTDTEEESEEQNENSSSSKGFGGGKMGMMGNMGSSGDFTVVGYSGDTAMTDFANGVSSVTDGAVFEEGTEDYDCIISEELATYNNLAVGDTITLTNINNEEETYEISVVGIYTSSESNEFSMSMFGASQDPANEIYMSSDALQLIIDASEDTNTTVTDDDGNQTETAMSGTLLGTYVFADTDDYYAFEEEVYELGLDESYTVSSTDISSFENSLTPLNTLSTMAGWFLVVILIIGAVILIVLNIFNVRERKYEIGVLTAMGMKKGKVALQFMTEIFIVTMIAVLVGAGIGAVSSVPVTNALLANQVESQENKTSQIDSNFGRTGNMGGRGSMPDGMEAPSDIEDIEKDGAFGKMFGGATDYITEIDSAMNFTVVLQILGIGILLTVAASAFSILFVMRYDPLKILANRD